MLPKRQILVILLLGFLVYANILGNGFVWDDEEQVVNNPYIRNFSFLPQIFTGSTFQTGGAGLSGWYFKPLMSLWFMVNYRLWGLRAWGFHLTQLLLHLTNSVLFFLLFKKFFNQKLAFLLALIFSIHPANVESVAYISASQEVLYTFFLLLVFLGLNSRSVVSVTLPRCYLLFLLGLLSKESAIVGLPIIFLYLKLVKKDKNKAFFWLIGSFLVFLFYFFWRTFVAKVPVTSHTSIVPVAGLSLSQRLMTLPFEIFSYLKLIFFPMKLFIAQHQIVRSITNIRFWGALPVVILFFWGLSRRSQAQPDEGGFFFFWFAISLGLVLNIYPLDMTIAERWLYFPLIGFLGLIGVFLEKLPKNKITLFLTFVVIVFSARTILRTFDWRNGLTLFGHDVKLNQEAFDLQNNYGTELFRKGEIDQAKPHFEKSIELAPNWWTSYNNLGVVYQRKGDFEKAKELYRQSIKNGDYYLAYENLASLMLQTERPEKAVEFTNSSLEKLPFNENLRKILVVAYARQDNYEKALLEAKKLYQLNPSAQNRQFLEAVLRKEKI